jgi:ABC-type transport system involved in cytochrome c biogenesis permease component
MTVFSEWYAGLFLLFTILRATRETLQYITLGKIMAASLIMGLLLALIAPRLHVFLLIIGGAGLYAFLLVAFGAISKKTLTDVFHRS